MKSLQLGKIWKGSKVEGAKNLTPGVEMMNPKNILVGDIKDKDLCCLHVSRDGEGFLLRTA